MDHPTPVLPSGILALAAASDSVAQPATGVTITVNRSGGSNGIASVSFATQDGTAVAGSNYTAASGTLTWNDGDAAAKTFAVVLASTAFDGSKDFMVALSNAGGATLGSPATATVTINGSGTGGGAPPMPGTLAFSPAAATAAQTAGSVTLSVNRSGGADGAATVSYATHDGTALAGSNYTGKTGTLTWSDGDAAAKTFTITLSTTAFTGSKNFSVTLSNATGAALGTAATATVTINGSGMAGSGNGPAASLAAKLGKSSRLLVGLGGQGVANVISVFQSQALTVDIYDEYLGTGDWTTWNSPPCDYVCVVAKDADAVGAIPMFTQYQMANDGDGNIAVINDPTFMATYWARVKLMYQDIAVYNKPVLVNLEPDFWGYAEQKSPGGDPTQLAAVVSSNTDCAALPDNVKGIAGCLIAMARKYAPKAYVGFPPATWGASSPAAVIAFMNAVGAQNADFIVEQTLDRDAGCFEVSPQPSICTRNGTGWYWDETNQTHPNFQDHLNSALAWHTGIGNLPLIWWQTPEGVPSATPGGTSLHYRDNRVHYFLTHPAELTAVGGLAVVFSTGAGQQTNITTDGGQFQSLDSAYMAAPAPLP